LGARIYQWKDETDHAKGISSVSEKEFLDNVKTYHLKLEKHFMDKGKLIAYLFFSQ
jgi:hypothetical protein